MGCATKCVAWVVFIFNIILSCLGIAILTLGILLQIDVLNYIIPITENKESLEFMPIAVIVVGGTLFIIGIFGCISAGKAYIRLLLTYIIILVIIFFIQVCLGVYVLFQVQCETELQNRINSQLLNMITNYHSNDTIAQNRIDALQRKLECCGVEAPADWNVGNGLLPPSCCDDNLACSLSSAMVYNKGCGPLILENFNKVVRITYILAFSVAAQQLLGVIFALVLIMSVKNDKRRARYSKYASRS